MLAQDLVNRALDQLPGANIIGAFGDGTPESEAARRVYVPTLKQLLRAAHWNFGRKMASLELLGDASGQTLDPATAKPISQQVEPPWTYCYAWPIDGVRARWLAWNGQVAATTPPQTTAGNLTSLGQPLIPARFLVGSSDQFPVVVGETHWDDLPDLDNIEGVGLISRRVVLTDVAPDAGGGGAQLVYTRLSLDPNEWDSLFAEGMVATLESRLAMPLVKDPKLAMTLRAQAIMRAKDVLTQARVANGNESGFPQSTDHTPDWISARSGGYRGGMWNAGPGYTWVGWEAMSFADGSVF